MNAGICLIRVLSTNFLQVSYTPAGEYRTTVGNHFQLYPSERNLALALVAVVKEYGWRQLSILTQNEQPFIQVSEAIMAKVGGNVRLR